LTARMQWQILVSALSLAVLVHSDDFCTQRVQPIKYDYTTGPYSGCSGQVYTFACQGKCFSESYPMLFNNK